MIKTLCVFGTRPEAIKMASVIKALNSSERIQNSVCLTGQHQELVTPLLEQLSIKPDFNLSVLNKKQSLAELTGKILSSLDALLTQHQPNMVLVHGDTTTTLASALPAYYHRIPVGHVEAGLRTRQIYSPWPEEVNLN